MFATCFFSTIALGLTTTAGPIVVAAGFDRNRPDGAQLSHNAKRPLGGLLEMFQSERDIGEHAIDVERRHRAYPQ